MNFQNDLSNLIKFVIDLGVTKMTEEEITIQYLMTEFNNFKVRCAELEKENAKLSRKLELACEFYARKNSISMFEYEKEKFKKEIEERYNFEMEDCEDN